VSGIWLGVAAVAGVAVGLPAVVVAIVAGSMHWTFRKWRAPLAIALVMVAALGAYREEARPESGDREILARATAFRGMVAERPKIRGRSQTVILSLTSARVDHDWVAASGMLVVTTPIEPEIFADDEVYFSGGATLLDALIGEDHAYVRSLNGDGSAYAPRVFVDQAGAGLGYEIQRRAASVSGRLQAAVPGDPGILLSGLVMGDDTRLSPARRNAFVNTGTTHITAVSGSNFALLIVMLTWVGRNTGTRRRLWFQLGAVAIVWGYAAFVGFGPPAVRAAVVASVALFAVRVGRRPDFVTLIVLASALDVLVRPGDISRLSYQLSTASALALALVLPGLNPRGFSGWIVAAVLSTFAAELATLPFLLPVFPRMSMISIPANVLIALPTSLAFVLAMIASALLPIWPLGAEAVASVAGIFAQVVVETVHRLGSDRLVQNLGGGGIVSACWITGWCFLTIALMSSDLRVSAKAIGASVQNSHRTVALAMAGAIGGIALGVLAWSLH
jgi:ComEC/Rec2-related protein